MKSILAGDERIKGRIYISGPMTGYHENNYPFFNEFEAKIENEHEYFNPAEPGIVEGYVWKDYLKLALTEMFKCDCVILIGKWQPSKGCRLELYNAERLEMPIYVITGEDDKYIYVREIEPDDYDEENILLEANRLVFGDRQGTYGHPLDDYTKTSAFWNILLKDKLKEDLIAEDAVMCMMAVKMSREMNKHKMDNLVDLAGYAQCYQRVVMKRKEEK